MQKLGLYDVSAPPSGRKRTKARAALLMAPPDLQVRSSFEVGDTVYLTRGARRARLARNPHLTAREGCAPASVSRALR